MSELPTLYQTLADLRLALPATLLGTLLLRWLVKGFLDLMDNIQRGGWQEEEGLFGAEPEASTSKPTTGRNVEGEETEEETEVTPVVVKSKTMRNGLVLSLMGIVATTYFADGAAQSKLYFHRGERIRRAEDVVLNSHRNFDQISLHT